MADEQKPNTANDQSALTGATLASMQSGISLLTQMKGLLYDMSRNPLTATFAVYQVNKQLESVIGTLRRVRDESKAAGGGLKGMVNSQTFLMASAGVLGVAMSLRTLRQEINQTRLSLYAVKGGEMLGEGGFAAAFGFTKKTLDLQYKYGKEFVQIYMKTVQDIGLRLKAEQNMSAERKEKFLEVITGLSRATGVDYGRNIDVLQDKFAKYGNTMESALAQLDMMREAALDGRTAIGTLNEVMSTSVRLMTDMGSNVGPRQAYENVMRMNALAAQLKLSPQGMEEMYNKNKALAGPGPEAAFARQHLAMFLPKNEITNPIFKPYLDRGLSHADALAEMQIQHPDQLVAIMQQQGRELIPRTPKGRVDYARLRSPGYQAAIKPQLAPGYTDEDYTALAMQGDIDLTKLSPAKTLDQKLSEVANKSLPEFSKALDDLIEKAGTWQDALDAYIKKFKMGGPMQDILGTGIGELVSSGATPFVAGAMIWNMIKKWRTKAPEAIGEVIKDASKIKIPNATRYVSDATSTSTTAGAMRAAPVAEEVAKTASRFGKIGRWAGPVGAALGIATMDPNEALGMREMMYNLGTMPSGVPANMILPASETLQLNDVKQITGVSNTTPSDTQQRVQVTVNNYIDGEYVANIMHDAQTRRNYVTPNGQ